MAFVLLDVLRAMWALRRDRGFVVLALLAVALVVGGSAFYSRVEGLGALDAVYLSVTTLTTVGYGDVTPVTNAGKVFTTIFVLVGMGILLAFVTAIAVQIRQQSLLHRPLASVAARHSGVVPDLAPLATPEYDVLVIGSDQASRETAIAAARLGLRVVVAGEGHIHVEPRSDSAMVPMHLT
jgi:voltage-gated potassium channel